MTIIPGEVIEPALTAAEARTLTDRIRQTLTVAHDLIIKAYQGRAWNALGYDTWDAYCSQEFGEARMIRLDRDQRREIVAEMRQSGMSLPAISSATGIPTSTVHTVLPELEERGVRLPDRVQRTDGLMTKATRPGSGQRATEPVDRQPRQRPLPDAFFDAAYELTKAVERIQRLATDDRFPRNAEQVAAKHRSDLTHAADTLAWVIERLPSV